MPIPGSEIQLTHAASTSSAYGDENTHSIAYMSVSRKKTFCRGPSVSLCTVFNNFCQCSCFFILYCKEFFCVCVTLMPDVMYILLYYFFFLRMFFFIFLSLIFMFFFFLFYFARNPKLSNIKPFYNILVSIPFLTYTEKVIKPQLVLRKKKLIITSISNSILLLNRLRT